MSSKYKTYICFFLEPVKKVFHKDVCFEDYTFVFDDDS